MATLVTSVSVGSPDSNPPTTDDRDTTGVDGILVAVSSYSALPATGVTDNKGPNTYIPLTGKDNSGPRIQWFYCAAPTVGTGHHWIGVGGNYHSMIVFAFSGCNTGTFYDGVENNSTAMQPGSVTPTEDNCIIVAAFSSGSGSADYSIDSGFNEPEADIPLVGGQHFSIAAAYLIQASAAAVNPTWSGSSTFPASAIAVFRTTGGGGGGGAGETAHVFVF